ncbi:hypothetical protein, partial [Ellagibacter isourolithinifaciens]|uniref:hypothetical protein n=1 Tax=Ellagibacter isourolithinifaciens TaxID=2137581 RepID=UPI002E75D00A
WYDFHCGRRLSLESDLSLSQILGDGHIRFTAASMRCGPYTNISDVIEQADPREPKTIRGFPKSCSGSSGKREVIPA